MRLLPIVIALVLAGSGCDRTTKSSPSTDEDEKPAKKKKKSSDDDDDEKPKKKKKSSDDDEAEAEARMEPPKIGTRTSPTATLDEKDSADKAKYLGCDLRYSGMPDGSKIKLTWHVYADEEGHDDDDPINKTSGKEQAVSGKGVINAYLQSADGAFHPGIYECKWEAISSAKVKPEKQTAKITVGDVSKKKK